MNPIIVKVTPDDSWLINNGMNPKDNNCLIDRDRELSDISIEEQRLSEDKMEFIKTIKRLYYTYYTGSYEGGGDMVFVSDKGFGYKSLSHCSCYSRDEDIETSKMFDTLEEALNVSDFTESMKDFILKDYR